MRSFGKVRFQGFGQVPPDVSLFEFASQWQTLTVFVIAADVSPMKKASEYRYLEAFVLTNGRCERIRTFYPLHPMQVLANPRKLSKSLKVT